MGSTESHGSIHRWRSSLRSGVYRRDCAGCGEVRRRFGAADQRGCAGQLRSRATRCRRRSGGIAADRVDAGYQAGFCRPYTTTRRVLRLSPSTRITSLEMLWTGGAGAHAGHSGRGGHFCNHGFNSLATLYVTAAVIEHAVRGEGRRRDRDRESRARRDSAPAGLR